MVPDPFSPCIEVAEFEAVFDQVTLSPGDVVRVYFPNTDVSDVKPGIASATTNELAYPYP